MNISLISLHILSLYSISPLYTINSRSSKLKSFISNSQFTRSFSHIIYSTAPVHSTTIQDTTFMHMINTPVVFSGFIDGKCAEGAECCVSTEYYFRKGQIIENATVTNLTFPEKFTYRNSYFGEYCGDIKMTKCQFLYCYTSNENGGGLIIENDCIVILHNCIFDHCHSKKNGGAAAIAKEIKFDPKPGNDPIHQKTQRLDIQYTCFSDCYTENKENEGFGAVMIMGANSVTFFYASTVNCANHGNKPKGAQFDILSKSISSQFINVTGGKTIYCGSLEYREASDGFFQYQTITNLESKYAMSFTSVNINGLTIRSCNVYKNTLLRAPNEDHKDNPPSLIFVRTLDLLVQNFYFKENNMNGYGKFASKENLDDLKITLDHCFADTNDQNYWDLDYIETISCVFENKAITTFGLRQLKLGHCQGEVLPGQMIITSLFTASHAFSKSGVFSKSHFFTKSEGFTQSEKFTASEVFTPSHSFTPSHFFNATNYFTPSDSFTPSSKFSKSDFFSNSDIFTKSNTFTASDDFTSSQSFTKSRHFTKSHYFTSSHHFTDSHSFTSSNSFTKSSFFSKSFEFTSSNIFVPISDGNKSNTGLIIGAAVGSVAGASAIAGIIAFFIIRHQKALAEAVIDVPDETNSSVTVDNDLNNLMDKDDPFANDFQLDELN